MAFDSKDTAAFKGVWVFCEQREGVIMSTSYQLLSEGRKLANDLGVELCGVVLGKDIKEDYLKALGGYGADKVYYCNHELLDVYTTDAYTKVICDLVEDKKPEIFLIGATNIGRDLGPRCAARLHTGLTADCTHLDVDVEKYKAFLKTTSTIDVDNTKFEENTNLKMTRPAFGGHLMATIICPRFRPQMSTVRPGVMQTQPYDEAGAAASARTSRAASSWLRSWRASWAASWAPPAPVSTRAGSPPTTRWARPARQCTPASMWPWASPAPSSTWLACRTPSASSR